MRFHALATDYDGTLADHGKVDGRVKEALVRLRASGRRLILVTGRELEDLRTVFPEIHLFDHVVAENGAHLFRPSTLEERTLGEAPPEEFLAILRSKGVTQVSQGRVIVSTHEPFQEAVLETIRELGLEHQVIFNKGAVMVLPPGINKARGLAEALADLSLSPRNVVAIGDAENDNALLDFCECGVAVSDALRGLKERAALVTRGGAGEGVIELAMRLLENDLRDVDLLRKHWITLGKRMDGTPVKLSPYARGVLLAGTSGGGKTTFATGFLEAVTAGGYQYCVLDPEGDYGNLEAAVVLGDAKHPPVPEEAAHVLEKPGDSLVLCTLAVPFQDRPDFFQTLLPDYLELRGRTGRPHWLMVDEAHHLLPPERTGALLGLPKELHGYFLITLQPAHVNRTTLEQVEWVLALGDHPEKTLEDFAKAVGRAAPACPHETLLRGEVLAWRTDGEEPPFRLRAMAPRTEIRRHVRKYSAGELGPDKSFRFRGPEDKLNLRAQNLILFMQIAEGVDDATWMHHLRQRDYSRWFHESIKDDDLSAEARTIEDDPALSPAQSRAALRDIIERRYTGPA